ncbi:MAG: undecaprenyldiphospho-muramoylpentapeptide beta-N-acetylglucosaminyltransferase [Candidatus Abyssobacteria bacterium SURF_5]|uniref:UDP-N-acetylglucosamine--N-acetylmuramyl-(pentapeptide) pyrophosphoryl-undecaprenol N-acetylglucosamine transferase n=1 Tax=Abyssobacteria bacterium (strain SURF_5) TaxID=2093360 RepID=A0A3A4NWI2_ABYX5|nr:MAG: undecaprenyldiphospho-muramoylpentapeptide beta-N-acetylglucosaminyltransferase [Candidatus Abyssubacteria bacterium SURF_5]
MKVVLAGGGTGGHVFPAVAIAEELKRRDPNLQLMYLGKRDSIEERTATQRSIPFRAIQAEGFPRGNLLKKSHALLKMAVGLVQSIAVLSRFRPQVVIGTGGYASMPPVLAASLLRMPSLIHEQNCVPGKANRVCSRFVDVVTVHFEKSRAYFPVKNALVVGNPIRSDFLPQRLETIDKAESKRSLGLSQEKFTVFLLGGSRGAHSLNVAVVDALPHLDPRRFQLICMTGTDDFRWVRDSCERAGINAAVFPFIDDMVRAYGAADVVVSRAGASTLAELAAVGVPAILVPYPHATDRHQELNARVLVEAGAALMMLNGDLRGDSLAEKLLALADEPSRLNAIHTAISQFAMPDAAERVVNLLFELVFQGE